MKKEPGICFLLLLALSACKNNDHNDQFRAMDEGLKRYGNFIRRSNEDLNEELKDRRGRPEQASKMAIWQPKATYIKLVADSMDAYIASLRAELRKEAGLTDDNELEMAERDKGDAVKSVFEKQGRAKSLYQQLNDFNEKAVSVFNPHEFDDYPVLKADVEKSQQRLRERFPFRQESQVAACFKNIPVTGALAMLNKIQNDVDMTAHELMEYCGSQVGGIVEDFEKFSGVATQNTNYLKAGEPLEIYAGVGSFTKASTTKIIIDGKTVIPGDDNVALYKKNVAGKPGKYTIPVKIIFTWRNGRPDSLTRKITYTVLE